VQIHSWLAPLGQLARLERRVSKAIKVSKASKGQLAHRVFRAFKVFRVSKAQQVHKAFKAILAQLDPQVLTQPFKAPQARLAPLALIPLCQVLLGRRAYKAFKANRVSLDRLDLKVLLAQLEALATQVQQAHLVLLAQQEPLEPMVVHLRTINIKPMQTRFLVRQITERFFGTTQRKHQLRN
jgi:hypothetical protein